ncbi:MAG: response regulator [Pseudomonadota bacterium]
MSQRQQKLLVVDDEPKIRQLLKKYLAQEGFIVDAVNDGQAMDKFLSQHPVDLIILDLMLPGEDGLSIARRIRHQQKLPIIILSARGEELDKIIGLEMGADDYLSKPFNPRELLARIRSVMRRSQTHLSTVKTADNLLQFGPYSLNIERHTLAKDNQLIQLTSGEFTLLKIFLEHSERVLNRDTLLDITKGYKHSSIDRSIDVCVGRLRRKIEPDPSNPIYLRTVRGVGYIFSKQGSDLLI